MFQDHFDKAIGQLDRVLSLTIGWAKDYQSRKEAGVEEDDCCDDDGDDSVITPTAYIDEANAQTLKHHAEDMIGAGKKILDLLALSCNSPHDAPQEAQSAPIPKDTLRLLNNFLRAVENAVASTHAALGD